MNDLQSALAQPIADFLQYQQALNKKYQTESMALRLFDRYLFEQGITGWQAVTSSVIAAFMHRVLVIVREVTIICLAYSGASSTGLYYNAG
jgi:hypothetical protein